MANPLLFRSRLRDAPLAFREGDMGAALPDVPFYY